MQSDEATIHTVNLSPECQQPQACTRPSCGCESRDPGIAMGSFAEALGDRAVDLEESEEYLMDDGGDEPRAPLDPNVEHDIDIVLFTGEDSVPAIVVYVDETLYNYQFTGEGADSWDGETYAEGLADGLSMMGCDVTIMRWKYNVSLVEDEQPPRRLDELETRHLEAVDNDEDLRDMFDE